MGVNTLLPSVTNQAQRLIELGVPGLLGQDPGQVMSVALALEEKIGKESTEALLVPTRIMCSYADLMRLVTHQGHPGFVVEDFTDAADFITVTGPDSKPIELPDSPWYLLTDPRRGDEFENSSPAEALETISEHGRITMTIGEGIFWLLQNLSVLERNHCFMTIGSRKLKSTGAFDARTPALWISNGTGRDGKEHRDAPKLGWCWWNNRHTWLGIAHAERRAVAP
ncbi:hypothetical protein FYJ24_06775 [Actinomycetaceae bacterium WB03_NA08]|uniref:Uncharacterized protein n=1 Tax=Scrofimicrobium canadense TaxID=2652290 RepID=A0A6N7VU23_9ACTO|nr:hypothetical protein [Scrofimicrobium canadense]